MIYETPRELLARLKTGREESMQRLLTTLILDAPYPKWNSTSRPSPSGIEFLRSLRELSFVGGWEGDDLIFVDEYELRGRTDDERGGAPDYVVLWPNRIWIIELKTEVASHRAGQLPLYLELGHHYFPDASIDLTYLTPPCEKRPPETTSWSRYSHVTWQQVAPLIQSTWARPSSPEQGAVVAGLWEAVELLDQTPSEWRAHVLGDGLIESPPAAPDSQLVVVSSTASDGQQRAVEGATGSLDDLMALRVELQELIAAQPAGSAERHVRPWIWRQVSSGGVPLSQQGSATGYELRVSRYQSPI